MSKARLLRKAVAALFLFGLPTRLVCVLLNSMGHRIQAGSRVGFSWLWCDFVGLETGARIGHFNYIAINRLLIREAAYIGRANVIKGPLYLVLKHRAAIGNTNLVLRGSRGVTTGTAQLWLGELAKITANHRIDCTQSIRIGAFSTIAGAGSQLWTHGYVHALEGSGRYRIDGRIEIEENVYVGSASQIAAGVRIAAGVLVGAGTTISKNLTEPGLYVSATVRSMPRPPPPQNREDLVRLTDPKLVEPVFLKRRP